MCLLILSLTASSWVTAQVPSQTPSFFEHNFASSGGLTKKAVTQARPSSVNNYPGDKSSEDSSNLNPGPSLNSQKVLAIALIANTENPTHVNDLLSRLKTLFRLRKIPLLNAVLIGKGDNANRMKSFLTGYNVNTRIVESTPPNLGLNNSPAWILSFGNDSALLDGYFDISRFISPSNDFISPEEDVVELPTAVSPPRDF